MFIVYYETPIGDIVSIHNGNGTEVCLVDSPGHVDVYAMQGHRNYGPGGGKVQFRYRYQAAEVAAKVAIDLGLRFFI